MAGRGGTPELKTYTESTAQDNATNCPLAERNHGTGSASSHWPKVYRAKCWPNSYICGYISNYAKLYNGLNKLHTLYMNYVSNVSIYLCVKICICINIYKHAFTYKFLTTPSPENTSGTNNIIINH